MQPDSTSPRALIVIDVQDAFHDSGWWGRTTNPAAEAKVAALVEHWRAARRGPVVIVRHDSVTEGSPLHPDAEGNRLQAFLDVETADLLVTKTVNSAFYGDPDLHAWLGQRGIGAIAICGIQTNMCAETTARMAGNLGYDVEFVLDATRTFDLGADVPGLGRVDLTAEELMRATAVNLAAGGFARVVSTDTVIAAGA